MQEIKKIEETAGTGIVKMPESVVSKNFENINQKSSIFALYLQQQKKKNTYHK